MTDEIFRDNFCDDIFRSMKAQMEPSDDVVASLLAQIAAEAPSSVTEQDNVIPFRTPAEIKAEETAAAAVAALESTPRKHFASKKTNKSIWYYGTAVAASIIVMISTFALLDTNGDDASGVKDLFNQAVGPNTQIVTPGDSEGTEEPLPVDGDEPDISGTPDDTAGDVSQDSESGKEHTPARPQNSSGNADETSGKDAVSSNGGSTDTPKPDNTGNGTDSGVVTPGSNGTEDIPWTNEIISNSQVASISISGGNYVVENTVSRSDVGATIETVTITLPQTSTTNAGEVKAKVRVLKNVSSAAMVALDVEGFDQPLVYANADYAPATLGQFVSDLGLEKKTTFSNTVRCQISMVGYSSNHSYNWFQT